MKDMRLAGCGSSAERGSRVWIRWSLATCLLLSACIEDPPPFEGVLPDSGQATDGAVSPEAGAPDAGGGLDAGLDSGGPGPVRLGDPCRSAGEKACDADVPRNKLICFEGRWSPNGSCEGDTRCGVDAEGARGVCVPAPPGSCPAGACAGGSCVEGADGYSCQCGEGYSGTGTTQCVNIDDCPAGACEPGGRCLDGIGGYTCECDPGFRGSGTTQCVNIDDCPAGACEPGGRCVDGVQGYSCECDPGFTGTGTQSCEALAVTCVRISEVVEGTSSNKAVELWNCGDQPLELDGYMLCLETNANSSCGSTLSLTGQLPSDGTWVVCNTSISDDSPCDEKASVADFNGDDRLALFLDEDGNGTLERDQDTLVDAFGRLGTEPPAGVPSGAGEMPWANAGFRRTVCDAFATTSQDFDVLAYYSQEGLDDFSDLGVPPALSCAPSDPWVPQRDEALKASLHTETSATHVGLSYAAARDRMYAVDTGIDVHGGLLECIYTGRTVKADGGRMPGGIFNTEHTWPQSEGAKTPPAQSDLHHLFPTFQQANSERASLPFGVTVCEGAACPYADGGSERGLDADGDEVFEVRTKYRGDVARAHFYFSVRYELPIPDDEESTLRVWHVDDPPSDEERTRNDAIEGIQGNRNPFVDYPGLVDRIADF